ncbi:MAG: 6-phosphofructokinase [Sphingomicrobium sp.]
MALYTAYATSIWSVTPEYKVNLDKLIQLLLGEKRANPSNYALIVLREGAEWEGYKVQEYGEPDPYGHRKKASVAEVLADKVKERAGEETIVSDLTYDLRSGNPDFTDKLVALTFGNMAYDAVLEGRSGLMSALVEGRYDLVPIPDAKLGPRANSSTPTSEAADLPQSRVIGVAGEPALWKINDGRGSLPAAPSAAISPKPTERPFTTSFESYSTFRARAARGGLW